MSFWLYEPAVKVHLRALTARSMVVLSSVFFFSITCIGYRFLQPKLVRHASQITLIAQLREQQKNAALVIGECDQLKRECIALHARYDVLKRKELSWRQGIDVVIDSVRQAGLCCKSLASSDMGSSDRKVTLGLSGTYHDVFIFFKHIAAQPLPFEIVMLDLQPHLGTSLQLQLVLRKNDV